MREWIAFAAAALFWGSSFLWIKVALNDIGPFALVGFRVLFGVLGLAVAVSVARRKFPRDRKTLKALAILSLFSPGVPFMLISWSETRIASSLASILNGTVPLFTLLMAHLFLEDEKISRRRLGGLLVGFLGVAVLVSRDFTLEGLKASLPGELAVIVASMLYAYSVIWSRKHLRGMSPVVQTTSVLLMGMVICWSCVPVLETHAIWPTTGTTWFAVAWLGLLGTCGGFLCFFYLLNAWGPTRATLVNYVFPLVGFTLGIVFLGEPLDIRLVIGTVCVVAGVLLVNSDAVRRARKRA